MNTQKMDSIIFPINQDSSLKITSIRKTDLITVEIPNQHVEKFLLEVEKQALLVESIRYDQEEKGFDFLKDQLKSQNRDIFVSKMDKSSQKGDKPGKILERLDEKTDLLVENEKINRNDQLAKLELDFYQNPFIIKEHISNTMLIDYGPRYVQKVLSSLEFGWGILGDIILFLLKLWSFLLIGSLIFLGYKYFNNRYPNGYKLNVFKNKEI